MNEEQETIPQMQCWSGAVEIMIELLEYGTPTGKEQAKTELRRIAKTLDESMGSAAPQ
jgi:hypothetical protein|tara:strand:- start:332 stop:505 length:174 start_codon:yes stop_codon:yes gene_type:complete